MAFVSKSQRIPSFIQQSNTSLGPGEYFFEVPKRFKQQKHVQSIRSPNPTKDTPGPGTYEHKVPDSQAPTIHSESKRFEYKMNGVPGPGAYYQERRQRQEQKIRYKPKLIESLIYAGMYQQISSIPYEKRYDGQIGPGEYHLRGSFERPKHIDWSKQCSSQKITEVSDLGPGSYDLELSDNKKQGSTWKPKSRSLHQNIDNSDSEYEYIEDATPGPGTYINSTATTKLSTNSWNQKAPRFRAKRLPHAPGPGTYDPKTQENIIVAKITKAPYQVEKIERVPGPNSYDTHQTLKDKVIKYLIRNPLDDFGKKQQRFKSLDSNIPGPGAYELEQRQRSENNAATGFKSTTDREIPFFDGRNSPSPGDYTVTQDSIAAKLAKNLQRDLELSVQKPGFNSSAKRLKHLIKEVIEEEDEKVYPRDANTLFMKQARAHAPFLQNDRRFKEQEVQGPTSWDYQQPSSWIKKSYNIEFIE